MAETKVPATKQTVTSVIVKYKVTCDCYWNAQLWHMDDIAELPSTITPPKEYFDKM
ncbi:MAG: hypothetical protein J6P07_06755 [Spirochaetaceae bacterium]|nr:hypothetical protein [Spirochaetaceae bacterium]MBO7731521.1 hypothetical protein [Methanobrevibacter sp.]